MARLPPETGARQVTRALLAITILAFLVTAPDAKAIIPEVRAQNVAQVLHEREQARKKRQKWLSVQRYREWRAWRKNDIRRRCHRWARHELAIGVGECGYNVVPRYGVYGIPWCAAFVAYVVDKAEPGRPLPSNPNMCSCWEDAIRHRKKGLRPVWTKRGVKPGDIVVFWGHIGIVDYTTRTGFWSIEGNATNRVARRFHYWYEAEVFGRLLPTRVPERFK